MSENSSRQQLFDQAVLILEYLRGKLNESNEGVTKAKQALRDARSRYKSQEKVVSNLRGSAGEPY